MGNFGQNDVAKVLAKHFSFQPLDFCFRKPLKSLTAYLRQFASRKNLKFCEVAYVGFPSLSAVQAHWGSRVRVIRTSNGYQFNDPKPLARSVSLGNSSKSDFPSGTSIQESIS